MEAWVPAWIDPSSAGSQCQKRPRPSRGDVAYARSAGDVTPPTSAVINSRP